MKKLISLMLCVASITIMATSAFAFNEVDNSAEPVEAVQL